MSSIKTSPISRQARWQQGVIFLGLGGKHQSPSLQRMGGGGTFKNPIASLPPTNHVKISAPSTDTSYRRKDSNIKQHHQHESCVVIPSRHGFQSSTTVSCGGDLGSINVRVVCGPSGRSSDNGVSALLHVRLPPSTSRWRSISRNDMPPTHKLCQKVPVIIPISLARSIGPRNEPHAQIPTRWSFWGTNYVARKARVRDHWCGVWPRS
jgi:hypothetical protein